MSHSMKQEDLTYTQEKIKSMKVNPEIINIVESADKVIKQYYT